MNDHKPESPSHPSRRAWLYGAAAVLAAGAGAGAAWWKQRPGGSAGGDALGAAFWDKRFERPEGGEVAMASLRGKPVLLNFWATWCAPCVEEMPELSELHAADGGKKFQVIGIGIDSPSNIAEFTKKIQVAYPIYVAGMSGTELSRQFGNVQGGLPFTVLVGADGTVKKTYLGRLKFDELKADLAKL